MIERVRLEFSEAASPACPAAVGAFGPTVPRLLARLIEESDASLAALSGVGDATAVFVLGDESALPWVDGVVYFARSADAPGLLLPTTRVANVPASLLERLLAPDATLPAVVVPTVDGVDVYSLSRARPLRRSVLEALARVAG